MNAQTNTDRGSVAPIYTKERPMNENLIKRLARVAFDDQERFERLGMMNTYGLTQEERREQEAEYALAKSKLLESRAKLREAQGACEEGAAAIEELTRQRDEAIQHIAEWCVAIDVNGTGWDDWDDYYKDAMDRESTLPEIRGLLTEAIEAARKRRASW